LGHLSPLVPSQTIKTRGEYLSTGNPEHFHNPCMQCHSRDEIYLSDTISRMEHIATKTASPLWILAFHGKIRQRSLPSAIQISSIVAPSVTFRKPVRFSAQTGPCPGAALRHDGLRTSDGDSRLPVNRVPVRSVSVKHLRVTLRSMNVPATSEGTNGFAVRAERVSRHYRMGDALIQAVNEISLEIRAGEFLALLGASGSGKSTLLNLIAGLDRPTSGAILAQGRDLAKMSSEDLATHRNRTIGIVFQSFQLLPRMTLEENVELPLRLAEVPRAERPARVREALERVGLAARTSHRPTELSGGEQQRAAIARALVNRPMILLADEPTGNLDSKTGEEIMSLIAQIHRPGLGMGSGMGSGTGSGTTSGPGRTIIMVTHERALAERYADRIVTLSDGAISREERLR
jgi:putative ABC transport system ATP-binding protein